MQFQDYYKTLGVKRDATEQEIKKAYRNLARKHHPDVNKGADAEDRFKAINEANSVLSDPEKRAKYDRFGADWERYQTTGDASAGNPDFAQWFSNAGQAQGASANGGTRWEYRSSGDEGFSDFFETLFGGGLGRRRGARAQTQQQPRAQPRRGEDHEYPIELTLREAFKGTTRAFELQLPETCDVCFGSGIDGGELCYACGGSGSVMRRTKIEVDIPAGIREGQKVRVAGKGAPGRDGGRNGDVLLKVRIKPDVDFAFEHNDLRTDVEVPLYSALLGGEVVVRTLTGKVALTIPSETQNGKVFRLRGQGWPTAINSTERGDLLARVHVKLPTQVSERERELFEELRELQAPHKAGASA
jgi:molecular chaperone DnaJ